MDEERRFSRSIDDMPEDERNRALLALWVDYLNLLSLVQSHVMSNNPEEELIRVITYESLDRNKETGETDPAQMDIGHWQALSTINPDLIRLLRDSTGLWFRYLCRAVFSPVPKMAFSLKFFVSRRHI